MPEEVEIFLSPQVACVLYFYLLVSAQLITETRITQKRGSTHVDSQILIISHDSVFSHAYKNIFDPSEHTIVLHM